MFFLQIKYFTNWLFTMQNSNFKKVFLIFFLCFLGNYVSWAVDYNATVATGYNHTLFTKADGSLWVMGRNDDGQLGDGTTTDRNASVKIVDANIIAVAAGQSHSLYLDANGSLWAMGGNDYGQLGDGTTTDRTNPVQIVASGVSKAAANGTHSLFLKSDGSLWSMGRNNFGQLGNGNTTNQSTPVQVLTGVDSMAAGLNHSLAVKTDGSFHAWGRNQYGQLGDGTTTARTSPTQLLGSGVSAAAAGQYHSLFLKTNGSLHSMGWNQYGQLGDGSTTDRNSSVQLEASGVSTIAAGIFSSYYLMSSGVLKAVGRNNYGQLGDGTTTDRTTSVILGDSNLSKISSGQYHAAILAGDKSLRSWGRNNYGELGDGTTTDRTASVEVISANAMQPKTLTVTVVANSASAAVTASGDFNSTTLVGTYDKNSAVNLTASLSSLGYIFSGWSGDLSGTNLTPTLTMSDHRAVTAVFSQDTGDTDGDGLTNYAELKTHSTDPNDSDSDDDTLTDGEEIQIGLNPNSANTALVSFFDTRILTARSDGNTSGIAYVQANLSSYNLYTEVEKNASVNTANTAGKAEGLATVQADMASKGLSVLTYIDQMSTSKPYTSEWFYQPGMGWMWTSESVFPFVYQVKVGAELGAWLYFGQLSEQASASFYDYATETWITPTSSE